MAKGAVIRHANPNDEDEITRLYIKSWQAGYHGLLPQEYLDGLDDGRWHSNFTGLDGSFVITDGERIVGNCCARASQDEKMPDCGELWTLYVLPEYWGRGYGTALLEYAAKWLFGQGFDRIYLWVLETNVRARRFYEKCGFKPTADTMNCIIADMTTTEVRYVREKIWQI